MLLKVRSTGSTPKGNVGLQVPGVPFGCMRHTPGIVALETLAQIVRQPGIESPLIRVALEDVDVVHKRLAES